jgi:outer membrane biosynthesis protein TonB
VNIAWMRAQDRRRSLAAAGSTLCIYALALLGVWLIGRISPVQLSDFPGTVLVDLGGTETAPGEVPQGLLTAPDRPLDAPPGAAPQPSAAPAAPEPPAPAAAAAPKPSIPAPAKAAPAKAAPKSAPKAAPSKPSAKTIPDKEADAKAAAAAEAAAVAEAEQAAADRAAEQAAILKGGSSSAAPAAAPKSKTFGSGAAVVAGGTGSSPGVAGGTASVTFKGSEMGSALATTFGASSGQVGRNLYVPIYLYMPLPAKISAAIYGNIQAKGTFQDYYQQSGTDCRLKSQVPLAQRGDFWAMLEAAGYDASTADYKTSRKLSPVVIEFTVGPMTNRKTELVDVRLVSSSGSTDVDEAVMFGFRQAAFFNKTGNAVGGKFVYSF